MKTLQTTPGGNPPADTKGKTFFTFDRIFDEDSATQEVYKSVAQEIVHVMVTGLNGAIFAYGQTSSGNAFTMQGGDGHDTSGIMQMVTRDLFDLLEQASNRMFIVRALYVEVFGEDINNFAQTRQLQTTGALRCTSHLDSRLCVRVSEPAEI